VYRPTIPLVIAVEYATRCLAQSHRCWRRRLTNTNRVRVFDVHGVAAAAAARVAAGAAARVDPRAISCPAAWTAATGAAPTTVAGARTTVAAARTTVAGAPGSVRGLAVAHPASKTVPTIASAATRSRSTRGCALIP
jgi:hypothetical protein